MAKGMFIIQGNLCSERVRIGRALQSPPMTQEDLARKIQLMGEEDMTKLIISRIEKNQRNRQTSGRIKKAATSAARL